MSVQGLHGHCISSGQLQTLSAPTLLSTWDTVFLSPSGSLRHCEAHLGRLSSSQMSTAWQATEHFGFYLLSRLHTNCHADVSSSLGWDASESREAGLHSVCVCVSNNSKASSLKSCFWKSNHVCSYLLRRQYLKIQNPERWSPLKERKRQRKKGYHYKTKRP